VIKNNSKDGDDGQKKPKKKKGKENKLWCNIII